MCVCVLQSLSLIIFKMIKFSWILIIEMRKFKSKYCILDSKYLSISKVLALQNGHQRELFIPRTHDKDKKQPNKKTLQQVVVIPSLQTQTDP